MKRDLKLDHDEISAVIQMAESLVEHLNNSINALKSGSVDEKLCEYNFITMIADFCQMMEKNNSRQILRGVHLAQDEIEGYDDKEGKWLTGVPHAIFEHEKKYDDADKSKLAKLLKMILEN